MITNSVERTYHAGTNSNGIYVNVNKQPEKSTRDADHGYFPNSYSITDKRLSTADHKMRLMLKSQQIWIQNEPHLNSMPNSNQGEIHEKERCRRIRKEGRKGGKRRGVPRDGVVSRVDDVVGHSLVEVPEDLL